MSDGLHETRAVGNVVISTLRRMEASIDGLSARPVGGMVYWHDILGVEVRFGFMGSVAHSFLSLGCCERTPAGEADLLAQAYVASLFPTQAARARRALRIGIAGIGPGAAD